MPQDQDQVVVNSLAVRLPPFWSAKPELWFAQVEAAFDTRNPKITQDSTKFSHVLQVLPEVALLKVEHVIARGGDGRYEALKEALIESFGKSVPAKQAQLVGLCANPSLGDRKPIEYLRHIQSLSGSDYKAVERAIFLHGMPPVVRTALADSHATSNEDLALRAGVILEEYRLSRPSSTPAICGVMSPSPVASSPDTVAAVSANSGWSASTSPIPSTSGGSAATGWISSVTRPSGPLCPVHLKYGAKAFVCRGGNCSMKNQLAPRPKSGNGNPGR